MCLGVPGKVVEKYEANGVRMATIDFGGVRKETCLEYLPDLDIGDYAIVHVGFAISQLDEAAALETLRLFQDAGLLDEEFGAIDAAVPRMGEQQ